MLLPRHAQILRQKQRPSCARLYGCLTIPDVAGIWRACKDCDCPNDNDMAVECYVANEHVMVRTRGSGNGADWRHFAFSSDPEDGGPNEENCVALRKPAQRPLH